MKWLLFPLICGLLFVSSLAIKCDSSSTDAEARIKKQLICENNYDMTHKDKNTTTVRHHFVIRSFDYREDGLLLLNVWTVMKWNDPRLKWTPSSYDNLDEIYEGTEFLWVPRLDLYNEEIDMKENSCEGTTCIINSKGDVRCVFPCKYSGQCDPDYNDWPHDKQVCGLTFGAWIHPGEQLNFTTRATTLDSESARKNLDWNIVSSWVEKNAGQYNNSRNNTYPSVHYAFFLQRHAASFTALITVPAMIFCALNLIALFLDCFSTERFTLVALNMVLHILHLQALLYVAPHNGDAAPKIVVFCRDSLFMTGFLAVVTIGLRAMNRCRGPMPNWLTSTHNALASVGLYKLMLLDEAPVASRTSTPGNQIEKVEQQDESDGAVLVELRKSQTAYADTESLWPVVARFIDRFLMIVFVLTYVALLLVWLPKSVTIEDAKNALGIE